MTNMLVVDTGPLIGLFYQADDYHAVSARGFQELLAQRTRVITLLPIVFEVYKWLLYNANGVQARTGLSRMQQSLEIIDASTIASLADLDSLVTRLSNWNGSLEDALVMLTASRFDCAVWTFNYRDFAAFKDISLWNPH